MVRAEVKDLQRVEEKKEATLQAGPTKPASPASPSSPPLLGVVVTAGGGALVAVGVGAGIAGELMFARTDALFEDRASGRTLALAGWAGAVVGAVVGIVGAAALVGASPAGEAEPSQAAGS
jgi:hypothetical protein